MAAAAHLQTVPLAASDVGSCPKAGFEPSLLQAPPGLPDRTAQPSSQGSVMHGTGLCKPCAWFWKPGGCQNGIDCRHCHMCPEGTIKARRKAKLEAMKDVTEPTGDAAEQVGQGTGNDEIEQGHRITQEEGVAHEALEAQMLPPPPGLMAPQGQLLAQDRQMPLTPPGLLAPTVLAPPFAPAPYSEGSLLGQPFPAGPPVAPRRPGRLQDQPPEICTETGSDGGSESTAATRTRNTPCAISADSDSPLLDSLSPPRVQSPGLARVEATPASLGSMMHGTGLCKPCAWFWKPGGCQHGVNCLHCHMCPEGAVKARRKAKFEAFKELNSQRAETSKPSGSESRDEEQGGHLRGTCEEQGLRSSSVQSMSMSAEALEAQMLPPPPGLSAPPARHLASGCLEPLDLPTPMSPPLGLPSPLLPAEAVPAAVLQLPPSLPTMPLEAVPLMALVPPSAGSWMHGTGLCKPCVWFWKPQGCSNGEDCQHCHLCERGELRSRRKAARALKGLAEPLREQLAAQAVEQHRLLSQLHDQQPQSPASPENLTSSPCEPAYISDVAPVQPFLFSHKSSEEGEPEAGMLQAPDTHRDAELEKEEEPIDVPLAVSEEASEVPEPLFSVGSALHGTGSCKPCSWFWKPRGCANGSECQHCHLCPDGEIKARRKAKFAGARLHKEQDEHNEMTSLDMSMERFVVGGA